MSMEFIMTTDMETAIPQTLTWNHEELKKELSDRLQYYKSLVVTEDTIKEGKEDRAKLNKLREALEARRKEIKKQCLIPYNSFEAEEKELIALIDEPIAYIDGQLAEFEKKRREEKHQKISESYDTIVPDTLKNIIPLERIFDDKWLNAGTTMKKIEEALTDRVNRTEADMMILDTVEPEYISAVRENYVRTLDIKYAIERRDSMRKADAAFRMAEEAAAAAKAVLEVQEPFPAQKPQETQNNAPAEAPVETMYLLRLELQLTKNQAGTLKKFLEETGITYRKI